jgi:hypothetical protein
MKPFFPTNLQKNVGLFLDGEGVKDPFRFFRIFGQEAGEG